MSAKKRETAAGRFYQELGRRRVIASAVWYLGSSFLVMQAVEVVFPYARIPDEVGTAVLVLLVVGFPVALILSWFFDIRPPRVDRTGSVASPAAAPLSGGNAIESRPIRDDAVAVLPFDNLSADEENVYFSDGITDDVIAAVALIRGLRVLSRASAMRYKGLGLPLSRIGAELGVATVVTGSVRRAGGRVRVVASMVDTRTEDHLWAESYDRDLEDIFEVQSEIAARVAEAVRRELSLADRRRILGWGTDDGEAYDLYLRGRHLWEQRTEAAVSEAIRVLQQALDRDPRFSLAHAALADAYTVLGIYGMHDPGMVLEAAMRSARAALELEPELGEAHAALACVRGVYDWDWASAEAGFQRAITLSPSYATAYQWYASNLLVPLGRQEEAKEQLRRAKELDPVSGAITASEGIAAFYAREWVTARATFEDLVQAMPRLTLAHLFLGQCLQLMGDSSGAIEALRHAVALSGESSEALAALAHATASAGRPEDAEGILGRLEARAEHAYVSPALLAQVLLGLGRPEEALDRLDEAAEGRASDLIWLAVRPAYDPIRSSERFRAIVQRVGLDGAT